MPADLDSLTNELPARTARWRRGLQAAQPWVAETDPGQLVGFAGWGPSRDEDADSSTVGEVWAIYVLAEHWGQGVGRELMLAALGSLRELGCREATLWVLESNSRARRFYEKGGWRPDGAARTEVREDFSLPEVRYRLPLQPAGGTKPPA